MWVNEEDHLDMTYGRFWWRYLVSEEGLVSEAWPDDGHCRMNNEETFGRLARVLDTLDENPDLRQSTISA